MDSHLRPQLALVGDQYNHREPAHPRIEALMPSFGVDAYWIPTAEISEDTSFTGLDGIWVVPGAPYQAQQGVHRAIQHARTNNIPFLGTCGGFYSTILEYSQDVLELAATANLKDDLEPIQSLIIPPTCSADDTNLVRLALAEGSHLSALYGDQLEVEEVLQCDYGMVQEFLESASQGSVRFAAWDQEAAPRALEISSHSFFLACLFQPELSCQTGYTHPIVEGFLSAVRRNAGVAVGNSGSPADLRSSVDVHAYEDALAEARDTPGFDDAFTPRSTLSQEVLGSGLRLVKRVSEDGTTHLLCAHNITDKWQQCEPGEYLEPARLESVPVAYISGRIETVHDVHEASTCQLPPGGVAWFGCHSQQRNANGGAAISTIPGMS